MNKAIELNPKYKEAYIKRAHVNYELGNIHESCLDVHKVDELGGGSTFEKHFMKKVCRKDKHTETKETPEKK